MRDDSHIRALHKVYCDQTDLSVPLSMDRIFMWERWLVEGHTAQDLTTVVRFLKGKIKAGTKTFACLRFHYLIGNLEFFSEDLAEAKALARASKPEPARASVMRSTGREPEPTKQEARSLKEVLDSQAFKDFAALKKSL